VPEILVYTTLYCPYCVRALNLLNEKGVNYKEIRVDVDPGLRREMESKSKRETVPQIFIGSQHVGGCDDMYALEAKGLLDRILGLK
jgi:glutaredoxin 3